MEQMHTLNDEEYLSRGNPTMWNSEAEFVEDFLAIVNSMNNSFHILKEFRTGYGIPDILLIAYNESVIIERKELLERSKLVPFNADYAYMMAYLTEKNCWIELEELESKFNIHNSYIKEITKNLLDRELLIKEDSMVRSRPQEEIFAINSIIAVEAKLKKWKEAIIQARRHLWFTKNSNILIPPTNRIQINKIWHFCNKNNVNIIVFDKEGVPDLTVKTENSAPYNTHLAWLLNEILLGGIESG